LHYTIEHRIPGRLRVSLGGSIPAHDTQCLEDIILMSGLVDACVVYRRSGAIALTYPETTPEQAVFDFLDKLGIEEVQGHELSESALLAPWAAPLWEPLAHLVLRHLAKSFLLPAVPRNLLTLKNALSFFRAGLRSLSHRQLDVAMLDAAAVGVSLVQKDFSTASSTMFLLRLSEMIEEQARDHSKTELIQSLLKVTERVWRVESGSGDGIAATEVLVDAHEVVEGDIVVIRTGSSIPVDGVVVKGEAEVNQATLTGEPLPVVRSSGDDVFAGTAVEEGELFVRVRARSEMSKLQSIISLVEQSESRKGSTQFRMERLASRFVPWNFLLAGVVALTTRSIEKVAASLTVDYSCALKLSGSIAVLAAMREAAQRGFTVKGSASFEAMAQADVIVFDKTGTLTNAQPRVCEVMAFNGWERNEVLRLAACLEEHFPHPFARAVVNRAAEEHLDHRGLHADVHYIKTHGIVSAVSGKRTIIGSGHFVFEDEGVPANGERSAVETAAGHASPLYLAVDGVLVGALCIDDPVKPHAINALSDLRALGFKRIIMLTGDNHHTAAFVARKLAISEFRANLLPEEKHAILEQLKAEGHTVVMVGDGINDSPALSVADVGIAMGDGAAIAREVADVTLADSDLFSLAALRRLSMYLLKRMDTSYRFTMVLNTALLALGISGIMPVSMSSLIHNGSTALISVAGTRPYLPS